MPDPAAAPDATSEAGAMPGGENEPTTTESAAPTQDELGAAGRRAIVELRNELRAVKKERDDLRDAGKSELEKAVARADKAERERDARLSERDARIAELEHEAMARSAAMAAGIAEHWNRLRGATAEELEADAKALAESFGGSSGGPTSADLGAGPRPVGPATGSAGFSEVLRRRANARR